MRFRRIIAPPLLALACLAAIGCTREADVRCGLREMGVRLDGIDGFAVESRFRPPGDADRETLVARDPEGLQRIRVTVVRLPAAEAKEFVKEQEAIFLSVFDPALPPYPEFLTRKTGCPKEYLPQERRARPGRYHLAYAGERLGYGVCSADLVRYRAGIGFFFCASPDRALKVEVFIPGSESPEGIPRIFDGLACL